MKQKLNDILGSTTPLYFENFLPNLDDYVTWDDVDACLHRRDVTWQLIGDSKLRDEIVPEFASTWYGEYQDTRYVCQRIKKGYGFIIVGYGQYNPAVNELCREIEDQTGCVVDVHIYGGLNGAKSFNPHEDKTANFIVQIDGETPWKVDGLDIEPTLKRGNALYIPSMTTHGAFPSGQRLSMSIAMYPPEQRRTTIDRGPLTIF
tara:strand:+ start:1197 stop:1808 length:612 start_codon:yes stop_codon:yes gene_type:complete